MIYQQVCNKFLQAVTVVVYGFRDPSLCLYLFFLFCLLSLVDADVAHRLGTFRDRAIHEIHNEISVTFDQKWTQKPPCVKSLNFQSNICEFGARQRRDSLHILKSSIESESP